MSPRLSTSEMLDFDQQHLIHPYTSMTDPLPAYPVESASGAVIRLRDGRSLIDGMSSWWAAIHGYQHPVLDEAVRSQLGSMSHVMFGGLTHEPAVKLGRQLLDICPPGLSRIFYSDSGSVAVEVAIKMAVQYWQGMGRPNKSRLLSLRRAYHGDTFAAMSVCDPVNGMHSLFDRVLARHLFADAPQIRFHEPWQAGDIESMASLLEQHHDSLAAVILEPVVQGAGGMFFYSPDYVRAARDLCDEYGVLLIADEIATGFGRTGKLFACEHAGISPDILCLGKALTGGYMTLAATLTSEKVARGISANGSSFMHGPTFMANPMACAVASASTGLLLSGDWQGTVNTLESWLETGLGPCRHNALVADVRVLGAIGVVELIQPVPLREFQQKLVECGVWVRPFGRLVYLMPPYVISQKETEALCKGVREALGWLEMQMAEEPAGESRFRTGI